MTIHQKHLLENAVLLPGIALMLLGREWAVLFAMGLLLAAGSAVLQGALNRCPGCRRFLSDAEYKAGGTCPHCGEPLA